MKAYLPIARSTEKARERESASISVESPRREQITTYSLAKAMPTHQTNRLSSILSLSRVGRIADSTRQGFLDQIEQLDLALVAGEEVHVGEGEGGLLVPEGLQLL